MYRIGQGLARVTNFFGVSPHRVDVCILRATLHFDYPEWARECRRFSDLPRWTVQPSGHTFSTKVNPELLVWVMEETTGGWHADGACLWLADDIDAVKYRMSFD